MSDDRPLFPPRLPDKPEPPLKGANGTAPWPPDRSSDANEGTQAAGAGRADPAAFALPPVTGTGPTPITVDRPEFFVHHVDKIVNETRKQGILEGPPLPRHRIKQEPIVREGQWAETWQQALDPSGLHPRKHVLIIVSPRSYGSTTLALHLLAEHTGEDTDIVKLDADWKTPKVSWLPAEERRAYQVDLKDPEHDRISADFLTMLEEHARLLEKLGSYLVLNVAKDLWTDHYASVQSDIHVIHLTEPPRARSVVEVRLRTREAPGLIAYLHSVDKNKASLSRLDAVEAVRAADSIVLAWREHERLTDSPLPMDAPSSWSALDAGLAERIASALSDWRDKLDILFGETVSVHGGKDTSLPLEDRCLLLALAVRQSAPMPVVAIAARNLQHIISADAASESGFSSTTSAAFAGRGLRRRVVDVGAEVGSHDEVVFDQPGYGRAVLTYVWDNYEVMRDPLLKWLLSGDGSEANVHVVDAVAALTLRHGNLDHLVQLGSPTYPVKEELLSALLVQAVQDEHIGRQAWGILYGWASNKERATTVVTACRQVLNSPDVTSSQARMAMVRLRRAANSGHESARSEAYKVFVEQAQHPAGVVRLLTEVRTWQQSSRSRGSGTAAFLALMSARGATTPWLLSDEVPSEVDVKRALQDLLADIETAPDAIDRLTTWIRQSATDPGTYALVRDRLLPVLRGQKIFKASVSLMQALEHVSVDGEANAANDFWDRLVDPRVRTVIQLNSDSA
ncbi:hypothetical protein GA0115239_12054 [Streptomyces sp. BpilaLS-43]|uniref:hypothetical protein n=1 Tax=Streptomyces sp. BpilaLS-43 TaxID=1839778 RepID=UPI00081B3EDD|nr:hypothetical protein [Streptomyces sp. BpilaLS-43]SCE10064.1 hypothetical protein GA0115239_12054 [Streptomyces sp. BpilaLS-43]